MSSIPQHIGPYLVRREIGRGGMGVVYLARDPLLERDVAVKSLTPNMARDEDRLARFKREARLIAQLNHPNIAQVYHLLEHEDRTYLVLEYVPGRSLAEMIDREGALEADRAFSICDQVARAVEAAHARGIVHRDLKPANVLVTEDGTAKVLDFGIARETRKRKPQPPDGGSATVDRSDRAIRPSVLVGTPGYMAPEQVRGERPEARADIFSFGCILYECLTGRRAFTGNTTTELIEAPLLVEPDLSRLPDSLSEQVLHLIRDCLAKDVGNRLQAIASAREKLEAARGRPPTPSTPTPFATEIPNNLPWPTTSFVGRSGQLQELSHLLGAGRLLTLTGAGGCGKTRLSIELARRELNRFSDGVRFVELAPIADPDFVAGAIATALGVKDQPNTTTTEVLCEHLATGAFLLVLDNCEHLLDAASGLAGVLLRAAPELRIVATSREALHVAGEQIWRVPTLTLPTGDAPAEMASSEAVALFVDRARALNSDFGLDETNATTVARICRRLDGIPLAIELAAARTRVLTPQEIDERLYDRFRLLADDARGVPDRHRTLWAAVDWSYQTLSESEKKMFRAVSAFAGGWTLDAAVAVCGPGGRVEEGCDLDELGVLDLLTHLVDKSLVNASDTGRETRYRMLETVRQYAAKQLETAGETIGAWSRHLDFHLALAEEAKPELTGAGQADWLERLEGRHENMLAALDRNELIEDGAAKAMRLCSAMMRFWRVHGHFKTGYRACITALARPEAQGRTAERAGALLTAGVMAMLLGDYDHTTKHAFQSLTIERELGNQRGMARSLNTLGNSAYYQGDLGQAQRLHEESLAINRQLGETNGIATSLNNLANVAADCGSFGDAQRLYEEALEINRKIGNRASEAINLNNLGLAAYHCGDHLRAKELHVESLAIRRDLGDRHGVAESLNHLGKVARAESDLLEARRLHRESLAVQHDLGDKLGMTDCLDAAAMLATSLGEHERAARLLGAVERLRERMGAPRPMPEQQVLDACLVASRAAMGDAAFDDAVAAGGALSLEDTATEALAWLADGRESDSTVLATDPS
jgi:non-specific serine/threonine protein kinase